MAVRLFKPRHEAPPPSVMVAATRIETVQELMRQRKRDIRADQRAWGWYDGIGEVHFGIASGAREVSRSILKAVRYSDPMTYSEVEGPPRDLVMAIQSAQGGQAGLLSSFYANRMVTGDGYFFAYPDANDPMHLWFDFCSTDEILADDRSDQKTIRRQRTPYGFNNSATGSDEVETYNLDDVILARIWRPHPRFSDVSDSPLKALETVCEELDILTKSLKAKITSRLATAGFLLFPSSIAVNFQPPPSPDPNPEKLSEDPFINWVLTMMTKAVLNPSDTSSSIPFIFTMPDEAIGLVKWITTEASVFEVEIKQRNELIARLLHGLDLRPEQIEGFSDSNHWSAWSSQDVHLKVDVSPEMDALAWGLTTAYLWPQMRALRDANELDSRFNWTEDVIRSYRILYDLRELTVRPNKADSYGQVADRGALKPASLRAAVGANEEDAPDELEYTRMFGWKNGDLYSATMDMEIQKRIDWDKVVKTHGPGPTPDSPAQPSPVGPGTKNPGGPGDGKPDSPKRQQPQ